MRSIITVFIFIGLWLLLSGVYKPLTIGLGVLSAVIVIFVTKRMDSIDGDRLTIDLKPVAFLKYIIWLLVEIAKANWTVAKVILTPSLPIRQHLFTVPYSQKTDLGQVIFANSITLTPGTVSVETEPGHFLVHALVYTPDTMEELGEMDRQVSAIEQEPKP